jgi:hypothetical protein
MRLQRLLLRTRAIVVQPFISRMAHTLDSRSEFEEACQLAACLPDTEVCERFQIPFTTPHPVTLFGKGQLESLSSQISSLASEQSDPVLTFVNVETLTPAQYSSLSAAFFPSRVIDRFGLVLEIFHTNANNKTAKLQIELAQIRHARATLTSTPQQVRLTRCHASQPPPLRRATMTASAAASASSAAAGRRLLSGSAAPYASASSPSSPPSPPAPTPPASSARAAAARASPPWRPSGTQTPARRTSCRR